mmetsp:Transcript_12055/g.35788  ORF Transcript_12055/g.35788 Transcript_12055/m.35788 type:complete len:343 (-) Transcript_12055:61-1089(-)
MVRQKPVRGLGGGGLLLLALAAPSAVPRSLAFTTARPGATPGVGPWVGLRTARSSPRPAAAGGDATIVGGSDAMRFFPPESRLPFMGVVAIARALMFASWLYILGTLASVGIAVVLPYVNKNDPDRRRAIDWIIRTWSRWAVKPFFSVKLEGLENLPDPEKACIYVANHQSFMDILSCLHLPRSFKFISKAEIFKIPLIGWTMAKAQHISLQREDRKSQVEVFRSALKKLGAGTSLFIYPEGTRSKDGVMLDFKAKGAFGMARRVKVPIVPITVLGTGRMMPGGKEYMLYPSWAGVRIIIHKPISVEEVESLGDDELVAKARSEVQSCLPPAFRGADAPSRA